jgi:hypothetical protein
MVVNVRNVDTGSNKEKKLKSLFYLFCHQTEQSRPLDQYKYNDKIWHDFLTLISPRVAHHLLRDSD